MPPGFRRDFGADAAEIPEVRKPTARKAKPATRRTKPEPAEPRPEGAVALGNV
jgi:hypothetical protein